MTKDNEMKCEACGGTGFPPVKQPTLPNRKIYAAPCKECGGKGRIKRSAEANERRERRGSLAG
jgi:DnaJ-class molecular chaperone